VLANKITTVTIKASGYQQLAASTAFGTAAGTAAGTATVVITRGFAGPFQA
jgi:hypothetical protein